MPRGPIAGCLKVSAGCLEVPSRVASRYHVRVASRSQGTNFETKISILGVFLALPTETSFTTPHSYPKCEVWAIETFLLYDPFNPPPHDQVIDRVAGASPQSGA